MQERERIKNEQLGGGVTDNTGFSWLFCYNATVQRYPIEISPDEFPILRRLARRVLELSELPIQQERIRLWKAHLSLSETRPLVFIDPELAWYEILPHTVLQCHTALGRIYEYRLLKEIYWQENIGDDRVCRRTFSVPSFVTIGDFGLTPRRTGGKNGGAYHLEPVIEDYDRDLPKLHFRDVIYDREKSERLLSLTKDVFDGILDVVVDNSYWYSFGLTCDLVQLRGFENYLYDFYDYPDELKAAMAFLRDDSLHLIDALERQNLLSLNNGGEFMGTGGYGWCDELPSEGFDPSHIRTQDLWGYGESQESVSISPDAYGEFVLPYITPILSRFGLNAYGCCEPLDNYIDLIKKEVPRLRKVSVPPWSSIERMADALGRDYVFCWKMNPSILAGQSINEDAIRDEVRKTFRITHENGCPTEVLMRDVRTLNYDPTYAKRWTSIVLEEGRRLFE